MDLKAKDIDVARRAFADTYERLVKEGSDPHLIVIAMSEILAHCVAFKAISGGGGEDVYRAWLAGFHSAYRQELEQQQVSSSRKS